MLAFRLLILFPVYAYSTFFFQKQVDLTIQTTLIREAAERAESKRIAELFPIEWHANQTESSESSRTNSEQHLSRTEEPVVRTPSPVGNQGLGHDASPKLAQIPISNISQSETARYPPIRKSIFKTPALSLKAELQSKTGAVTSLKPLRNHFSKQSEFELPQSAPTKCGLFSHQIRFPAPYGLS